MLFRNVAILATLFSAAVTASCAAQAVPPAAPAVPPPLSTTDLGELHQLQEALGKAETQENDKAKAQALNQLGVFYSGDGNSRNALQYLNQALSVEQQDGDRTDEVSTLRSIGQAYTNILLWQKALDPYNQALAIQRETGDRKGEADTLIAIGWVYSNLMQWQKAIGAYNQALTIQREAADLGGEVYTLTTIGSLYPKLTQWQKAIDAYDQARTIQHENGDHVGEAISFGTIGWIYGNLTEWQKAIDFYNQALAIQRANGDRSSEAYTLGAIAGAYFNSGDRQKTFDALNQALAIYRQTNDHSNEANTLNSIGATYSYFGPLQKALDFDNQALAIQRADNDRMAEAATLNQLGSAYDTLSQLQKAVDFHNQALAIYHQAGDRLDEANTLNDIGLAHDHLGQPEKAVDFYNQALAIYDEIGDANDATTLNNIGMSYLSLGQPQKALESLNRALSAEGGQGDLRIRAATHNNLGSVYEYLGQSQKALDLYQEALSVARSANEPRLVAGELTNVGVAYEDLGQRQKALDFYRQALAIFREAGDPRAQAAALSQIGDADYDLTEWQKSLDSYTQVLAICREAGDRQCEAGALERIGAIYDHLRQSQRALAYLNQALPLAVEVNDPMMESFVFSDLMTHFRRQQPSLAIFLGKKAVNLVQQVRLNLQGLDKEFQQSFLASNLQAYRDLADLLIDQGRLPEAQEIISLMKEQEFKEFTRGSIESTTNPASLSPAEQKLDDAYQQQTQGLLATYQQWTTLNDKLGRTPDEEKNLANLKLEVAQGFKRYGTLMDTLDTTLQGADKEKLDRARQDVAGLATLVDNLDPGTVALYTLVVSGRYRVIVIRSGHALVERSTAISTVGLRLLAERLVLLLSKNDSDSQALLDVSSRLYNILIGPIAEDLQQAQAHTLIWELDDVLHYIPMAALYDAAGKQFLAERYSSAIITPSGVYHLDHTPQLDHATLLAMGLSRGYEAAFRPLSNVPSELGSIVRDPKFPDTHGVFAGTEWLNDAFTEKNLEAQLGRRTYKVVHLASHFNADPAGNDLRSFLLLAGQDVGGSGFHLTLDELKSDPSLDMPGVELLTLSACKTAVANQAADGHEIDGLGGIGQKLGAQAVMASLWEVNDESTGEFMADFYERWVGGGGKVTKAEALRQAQLDMLKGKVTPGPAPAGTNPPASFANPYYWAPFILMGNWR